MAKLPLSPGRVWEAWKEVSSTADTAATLIVAGDTDLVEPARGRFAPGAQPLLFDGGVEALASLRPGAGEIPLVFVSPAGEDPAERLLSQVRPPSGAVIVVDEGPVATDRVTWYESGMARVSFSGEETAWEAVFRAVLLVAPSLAVPLGSKYVPLRTGAALRVVGRTARQNTLVATLFPVPGADLPVMTLNEVKMVLTVAAMYGETLSIDRAFELLSVVGAGFAFRTLARELAGFIPGPGWLVKGAVGYTSTRALGEAAMKYFAAGAPATPSRLMGLVERFRR